MLPTQIMYGLIIGLVAGVSSGLFGIGGGVIIVPLVIYLFSFSQQAATATSLVALLLPVGILGVWNYYRAGAIQIDNIKLGFIIASGMFVGTLLGSKVAVGLQSFTLSRMFSVFLVIVAIRLWFTAK
ncbi:TSUP family transporter [Pseudobdellovibrio sp. HCB154]|uniref:TSUP family transporter n=1 Tax=Pseudobdellovibrio sp. HCB154 TaxID=3386277 RepID=UPI003916EA17